MARLLESLLSVLNSFPLCPHDGRIEKAERISIRRILFMTNWLFVFIASLIFIGLSSKLVDNFILSAKIVIFFGLFKQKPGFFTFCHANVTCNKVFVTFCR